MKSLHFEKRNNKKQNLSLKIHYNSFSQYLNVSKMATDTVIITFPTQNYDMMDLRLSFLPPLHFLCYNKIHNNNKKIFLSFPNHVKFKFISFSLLHYIHNIQYTYNKQNINRFLLLTHICIKTSFSIKIIIISFMLKQNKNKKEQNKTNKQSLKKVDLL